MTIFALFLCFLDLNLKDQCQMQQGFGPFETLAECQAIPRHYFGVKPPDGQGFMPMLTNPKMVYVCMSKHVDTWERPQ